MKVPEKYLKLNAVFQQLKSSLARLGIRELNVEGLLTGDSIACISVLHSIFFSPSRTTLANELLVKYSLSPASTEYKLTDTVFRIARFEFGVTPGLSVEQFLNGGSFSVAKLDFLTKVSDSVYKKTSSFATLPISTSSETSIGSEHGQSAVIVEESNLCPPKPTRMKQQKKIAKSKTPPPSITTEVCEESTTPPSSPSPRSIDRLLEVATRISESVTLLDEKITSAVESMDARLSILESRFRMWSKLGPTIPDQTN